MTTVQANIRTHLPHYVFLLVLAAGLVFARGGIQRNLWSLRYLWSDPSQPSTLADVEQLTQHNPRAHLWQAQDAFRAGDVALAETKIRPLIDSNQFDAPYLRYDTMRLYAAILAEKGNVDQALTIWRDLEDISSLQDFANQAAAKENLTIALRSYEIAQALDPQASAFQLANFLWRSLKEPGEAEAVLSSALDQFPYAGEKQQWLHLLGRIYSSQERWSDAIPIYEHLQLLDSGDVTAALALGDAKAKRGDGPTEVLAQYQLAVAADPTRGEGYFAIGQLLAHSGEFQRADQWFQQAVDRRPENLNWQLTYATNARDLSNTESMRQRYRQIEIAFPDNHRAQMEAAWAYFQIGFIDEAKIAADNALRLAGTNPPQSYLDRANKIFAE